MFFTRVKEVLEMDLEFKTSWSENNLWTSQYITDGYGLDDRDSIPVKGTGIIHFATMSRIVLQPTQPPLQMIMGLFLRG